MKNKRWIILNTILLVIFLYIYTGIYACNKLPFYDSSTSIIMFSCGFGYLALLIFYSVFWLIIDMVGLVYYWKKGFATEALKIFFIFIAMSVTIFFSVPIYENVENSVKTYKEKKQEELNLQKKLNTTGNYELSNCTDSLEKEILTINCVVGVNLPGQYLIKGKLLAKNPRITKRDETILETHPNQYTLEKNTDIEVSFEYKHLAKNKNVPNGPYTIELTIIPTDNLLQQIEPYTFSGYENVSKQDNYSQKEFLQTKFYSGAIFYKLPYKNPRIP